MLGLDLEMTCENFKKIGSELTEKSTKSLAPENCVLEYKYV